MAATYGKPGRLGKGVDATMWTQECLGSARITLKTPNIEQR